MQNRDTSGRSADRRDDQDDVPRRSQLRRSGVRTRSMCAIRPVPHERVERVKRPGSARINSERRTEADRSGQEIPVHRWRKQPVATADARANRMTPPWTLYWIPVRKGPVPAFGSQQRTAGGSCAAEGPPARRDRWGRCAGGAAPDQPMRPLETAIRPDCSSRSEAAGPGRAVQHASRCDGQAP